MHKLTNKGFTLLEVMIALVIFSIGLLGLAGMQTISMENNRVAYKRTVATQLAYDMADRIRNNPTGTYTHDVTAAPGSTPTTVCVSTTSGVCSSASDMATWDLYEWDKAIWDKKNSFLVDPRAIITNPSAGVFIITIGWNESGTPMTAPQISSYNCAASPPTPAGLECVSIRVEL